MFQPSHTELVRQVAELRAKVAELAGTVAELGAASCCPSCTGSPVAYLAERVETLERFILDPPSPAPASPAVTEPAAPATQE